MKNKYCKTVITTFSSALVLSGLYGNSHAEVIMDGSAGTSGGIQATPDNVYEITSDLGHISGHNLFHSFSQFNVEQNYTANFSDPSNAGISNIIARVTGSNPSEINGTLKSSIANADLYLLNPNGVLFGDTATLDISGSFYVSTANYLKFGDGYRLDNTVNPNMTFTSAPPSAFGFTSDTPGSIDVNGSNLSVNNGKSLSLVGGDVSLDSATLSASDGVVNIASVASLGEVVSTFDDVQMNGFTELGNIGLANSSNVDVSGSSAGQIVIRGGALTLDQSSLNSNVDNLGTDQNQHTNNIDIDTSKSVTLTNGSNISTNLGYFSTTSSNGITLKSDKISVDYGSYIESYADVFSSGDSSAITIDANELQVSNHSYIYTDSESAGKANDININVKNLEISEGSNVFIGSYDSGDTGNINIKSNNILIKGPELSDDPFGVDYTGLYTEKYSENSKGGDIDINNTNDITLDSRGAIGTYNYGAEDGGDVNIKSNTINVVRGSSIGTVSTNNGNGGDINISARELNVAGVHEDFKMQYGIVPIFNASQISTNGPEAQTSLGNTGNINLNIYNLNVLDGAIIETKSNNNTNSSGNINIVAHSANVSGINQFKKNTLLDTGYSANTSIRASSSRIQSINYFLDFSSSIPFQNTGKIAIETNNLLMKSGGYISSESRGTGNSNDIYINANDIAMESGSYVTTSSSQSFGGNSGNLYINADNISIDGKESNIFNTGIYSDTNTYGGKGGKIDLRANSLELTNGAVISSETTGDKDGGDITISGANIVKITNGSKVTAKSSEQGIGNAGDIYIHSDLFILKNSEVSTSAIAGMGGNIDIQANNIITTQDSIINASSERSISGSINIITNNDVISSLVKLPDHINNSADTLKNSCSKITAGDSSFISSGSFANFSLMYYLPSQIDFASGVGDKDISFYSSTQNNDKENNSDSLMYNPCFSENTTDLSTKINI